MTFRGAAPCRGRLHIVFKVIRNGTMTRRWVRHRHPATPDFSSPLRPAFLPRSAACRRIRGVSKLQEHLGGDCSCAGVAFSSWFKKRRDRWYQSKVRSTARHSPTNFSASRGSRLSRRRYPFSVPCAAFISGTACRLGCRCGGDVTRLRQFVPLPAATGIFIRPSCQRHHSKNK